MENARLSKINLKIKEATTCSRVVPLIWFGPGTPDFSQPSTSSHTLHSFDQKCTDLCRLRHNLSKSILQKAKGCFEISFFKNVLSTLRKVEGHSVPSSGPKSKLKFFKLFNFQVTEITFLGQLAHFNVPISKNDIFKPICIGDSQVSEAAHMGTRYTSGKVAS